MTLESPLSALQIAILVWKIVWKIEIERGLNDETNNACDYARYFNNAFSYASENVKKKDD